MRPLARLTRLTSPLIVAIALLAKPAQGEQLARFLSTQVHMGTSFEIIVYAADAESAEQGMQAAFARIAALDKIMSDYDPQSELSLLGKSSPHPAPVPVSSEFLQVLDQAQTLSRRTGGAFDVTVGPLTRLWRRARRQKRLPDSQRLAEAREAVGYEQLQLDRDRQTVQLLRPQMRLDLGGIAKGFAADAALEVLHARGITRALVNAGGDVACSGPPPGQCGWRIAVAPLEPRAPPSRFVVLCDAAVATSGDAWQFVEIDGQRYSHILDPHTGLGLTRRSSVTVVAPNGTQADGLASAVTVLGPERGLQLIEQSPGTAAILVQVEDDEVRTYQSQGFVEFLDEQ